VNLNRKLSRQQARYHHEIALYRSPQTERSVTVSDHARSTGVKLVVQRRQVIDSTNPAPHIARSFHPNFTLNCQYITIFRYVLTRKLIQPSSLHQRNEPFVLEVFLNPSEKADCHSDLNNMAIGVVTNISFVLHPNERYQFLAS
jgi:hypothetical protein